MSVILRNFLMPKALNVDNTVSNENYSVFCDNLCIPCGKKETKKYTKDFHKVHKNKLFRYFKLFNNNSPVPILYPSDLNTSVPSLFIINTNG